MSLTNFPNEKRRTCKKDNVVFLSLEWLHPPPQVANPAIKVTSLPSLLGFFLIAILRRGGGVGGGGGVRTCGIERRFAARVLKEGNPK
jgi:hypothetical protein